MKIEKEYNNKLYCLEESVFTSKKTLIIDNKKCIKIGKYFIDEESNKIRVKGSLYYSPKVRIIKENDQFIINEYKNSELLFIYLGEFLPCLSFILFMGSCFLLLPVLMFIIGPLFSTISVNKITKNILNKEKLTKNIKVLIIYTLISYLIHFLLVMSGVYLFIGL